ncbi:MFS transporter [Erwinia sp. E602]|uniref:MFS transporter n=1 Tax=unclassified Erwinia TaxID=2622719 RepID=UPI0006F8ACBD|nr:MULTISPECIES: MFS transporter [unclassified Erwinia]KQN53870.1 2-ketogluconate transporter [Erwinia sp. Leaf53]PLV62347.1 2-ketogluconate transporter [Erwinia sp. B116]QUG73752.1 MFS transporter [Erwinia sp. E602]
MHNKIPATRWWRVIVPILITCIVSFMDRVNISFALPGGMEQDLAITSQMAGIASGIFFIGYLFLQVPGGRTAVNGSGKRFIAWSLTAWMVVSIATGFVTNHWQLLALRFILGVSEGGMLPVVLTMIGNWFPERELGRANACVMMFAPLGGMVTAPLSGLLINTFDWRWLFIIEGVLSGAVLLMWWLMVADRPQQARWLPDSERDYLVTTLAQERAARQKKSPPGKARIIDVFRNPGLRKLVLLNFFYQTGDYGYTLWLPTILRNLTGANMTGVGLLAVLPFVATIAGIYTISLFSDRSGKRRQWVMISLFCFAAALLASVVLHQHVVAAYIALIVCGFFLKAATSPFWSMPGRLASPELAGSARGVINGLGNLGGFVGPWLVGMVIYLYGQSTAICVLAGSLTIAGLIAATLPRSCDLHDAAAEDAPEPGGLRKV